MPSLTSNASVSSSVLPASETEGCAICFEALDNPDNPSMIYHFPTTSGNGEGVMGSEAPPGHAFHVSCIADYRKVKATEETEEGAEEATEDQYLYQDIDCPKCRVSLLAPVMLYDEAKDRFDALKERNGQTVEAWGPTTQAEIDEMSEIVRLWTIAASEGYVKSQLMLGHIFSKGAGVTPILETAIKWYELVGSHGNVKALLRIGVMFYEGCAATQQNFQLAEKWFLLAAEMGSLNASILLGHMYAQGTGVNKDVIKALTYFEMPASQNNEHAQFMIAELHFSGEEIEKNVTLAIEYYEKSAAQDNIRAQKRLGDIYLYGAGECSVNLELALDWHTKAAEQGDLEAQLTIADMYFHGNPTLDMSAAEKWFLVAAEKGDASAMVSLGELYYSLDDFVAAFSWYMKSAESGNAESQFMVGKMFYHGIGTQKNEEEAVRWCTESDRRDYFQAQFFLDYIARSAHEKATEAAIESLAAESREVQEPAVAGIESLAAESGEVQEPAVTRGKRKAREETSRSIPNGNAFFADATDSEHDKSDNKDPKMQRQFPPK